MEAQSGVVQFKISLYLRTILRHVVIKFGTASSYNLCNKGVHTNKNDAKEQLFTMYSIYRHWHPA